MLTKKLDSRIGRLDEEGRALVDNLASAKEQIITDYENLNYASVVRTIVSLADEANRYVEQHQPWVTIKTDLEKTRTTLTTVINAVYILTIYLKPILPEYARKVEKFLNVDSLSFADAQRVLEDHKISKFERLIDRVDRKQVDAMIEESKDAIVEKTVEKQIEPIADECTIEDFAKVDMRIARIASAEPVEGADKLLHLQLDLGGLQKSVFAGIAKAYKPEELVGKLVVCVANLKPRKMKFGVSQGMILAAGAGGEDIFIISADEGVEPGQRVG